MPPQVTDLGRPANAGKFGVAAGAAPGIVRSALGFNRRVSAIVAEGHRCMVFGAVDLGHTIGNRDDQCGLRRGLPLAARRLAKMGRAASEQFIA